MTTPETDKTDPPIESEGVEQKHLSDALRVGFVLLTFGMLVVLAIFAFSGASSIDTQQRGIKKIFGRVTDVVSEGLTITWPFPVGEIEKVPVDQQTLSIEDFYFYRTDKQRSMDLDDIQTRRGGLQPGSDGALLTGDQGLLHVRLRVSYRITDTGVLAVKMRLPPDRRPDVPEYQRKAFDETILKNEVCAAAIQAMATRTAMAVSRGQIADYQKDVEALAQLRINVLTVDRYQVADARGKLHSLVAQLPESKQPEASAVLRDLMTHLGGGQRHHVQELRDTLTALAGPRGRRAGFLTGKLIDLYDRPAVLINNVIVEQDITWPLAARPAWLRAENAATEGHSMEQTAREGAAKILDQAAGASYKKLVNFPRILGEQQEGESAAQDGLIDTYIAAVEAGQTEKATAVLDEIDNVLISDATGGIARQMIERSSSFATNIRESVKGRLDEYDSKLAGYLQSPQLTLQSLWAETRQRILNNPLAPKYYFPVTHDQKIILRIGPDPDIQREMQRALRRFRQEMQKSQPSPTPVESRHE